MATSPDPADNNPYIASEVTERAAESSQRSQPGPTAIFFSVIWSGILGSAVAVVVYAATFAVTCLGALAVEETNRTVLDSAFAQAFVRLVVFGLPCITAIAAFVFTLWVKLGRATKKKH